MNLLFGHDKTVAEWVARQAHSKPFCEPFTAIGLIEGERLVGGFVFTGYNGDSVELSLAGRGVVTRSAWRAVLSYVFDQLGCQRMQMHTNRKNKPVLRMLVRMKMHYEGVARRYFGRNDGIVYSLVEQDLAAFKKHWKL